MFGKATARLNGWMLLLVGFLLLQVVAATATRPVHVDVAGIALTLPRQNVLLLTPETESVQLAVPLRKIAPALDDHGTWLHPDEVRMVLDPASSSLEEALVRFRRRENEPDENQELGLTHFTRAADHPSDFFYERRGDEVLVLMLCQRPGDVPTPICEATVDFRQSIFVTYSFELSRLPRWRELRDGVFKYMDRVAS